VNNQFLDLLQSRRSIRRFIDAQIKDEELEAILDAGMWAPSTGNSQGWHFTVIQNKDVLAWLNREVKEPAKQFQIEYIRKMANNEKLKV